MKTWFSIRNQSPDLAEICIYDEIGLWGITASDFITALAPVGNRKIRLRINSPGGDVFTGIAIFNRLKTHAGGVEVIIDGLAASMASVIAMVGSPIIMPENSFMMIHNPVSLVAGDAEEFRQAAELLDKVRNTLVGAYEKKTGMSTEELTALMDAETWMTAAEALEKGFCDEIAEEVQIAARFDTRKFRNAPKNIVLPPKTKPITDMSLRIALLAALSLSETPDKPLSDTAIMAEFNKSLGLGLSALTDISKARTDLTAVQGQLTTAQADVTRLNGELTTAKTEATNATTARTQFIADIKAALQLTDTQIGNLGTDKTILTSAINALAMNKAIEIAAAQGVPPVLKDFAGTEPPKTMTRKEFNGLTTHAQGEFCRKGGKLTD